MDEATVPSEPPRAPVQSPPVEAAPPQAPDGAMLLPADIVSRVDTGRLLREIEGYYEFMHQAAIKKAEPSSPSNHSKLLNELALTNKLDLAHAGDCQRAMEFLKAVHTTAPVMHMSFSADPSPLFTKKLLAWLRKEIHPLVLVQVGLQPNIGAGCVVRTTNKYFDFSLRQRFKQKREQLLNFFTKANTIAEQAAPAVAAGEVRQP